MILGMVAQHSTLILQAQCLSTLLSFDLDLGIEDYAGDTAKQVAETYNHKECLDVIREHLKRQRGKSKSPKQSPSARRSPPNSTEGRSESTTTTAATATTTTNAYRTRASSPGSRRSSTMNKGSSFDASSLSNDDLRNVAHPDVQLPSDTTS